MKRISNHGSASDGSVVCVFLDLSAKIHAAKILAPRVLSVHGFCCFACGTSSMKGQQSGEYQFISEASGNIKCNGGEGLDKIWGHRAMILG
jgi:hypothetical protein